MSVEFSNLEEGDCTVSEQTLREAMGREEYWERLLTNGLVDREQFEVTLFRACQETQILLGLLFSGNEVGLEMRAKISSTYQFLD